jgi:xanthosine utilization system XapX-like protein
MVISLSAALLLGIVLVVMLRSRSIKPAPAIVAALFGFFLASTNMAPDINRFLNSVADTINQIKL